eukprot:comp19268_c1_seq1/m.22082 comp19268_c1_seq1/g.22082  ORF comp19268_c1_seq1/g.22082 comp19268_c1_seq1/m.22082 type:complete len:296 (-) comp19268_c1_seq1:37-924(-)
MALQQTDLPDLKLVARGKVRDVYEVDEDSLLFVVSDRLSAFDVVMNNGIPDKGKVLNQISLFWFNLFKDICPNHVITDKVEEMPEKVQKYADQLRGRSQLVKKLKMLPVEVIVRGYITGSGWKEYQSKGTVCDIKLPEGLQNCSKLPQPLYTPSTKADEGHDENIHPDKAAAIIGKELNDKMSALAIKLYETAAEYAATRGIIIADTKFEFGLDENGTLVLGDEALTPDSSRFWPADEYAPGKNQNSYDKQYVRDWLESINFDKTHPVTLPADVVERTLEKYVEAFKVLTGADLQ